MKIRKGLAIVLCVLLLLSLAACSAGGNSAAMDNAGSGYNPGDNASPELSAPESGTQTPAQENQKLIQKVWLNAETEEMDTLLTHVNQRITALNGYVEAQEIYNGSSYGSRYNSRYANLTIRIPADKLNQFVEQVSQVSNIVSTNKTTENVTLQYVATESRKTALQVEESRLLELLAKAETMEDLLKIEDRLTDVRTELEKVTAQLRVYDNQVNYATIYLNIDEVKEYTEPVEEPETLWDRIVAGFGDSMENLGTILEGLLVFIVSTIPYMIPVAVIGIVVIVIVLLAKRKRNKKAPTDEKQA